VDNISIKRVWEDLDLFEIEVIAQSELICSRVKSYTTEESINELASLMSSFPQKTDDRCIWENGVRGDNSTPFVSLEFWCEDKLGHVIVEVYMEINDGASYSKHNCCFFVKTEIGLLNSFGRSLPLLNQGGIGKEIKLHKFDE